MFCSAQPWMAPRVTDCGRRSVETVHAVGARAGAGHLLWFRAEADVDDGRPRAPRSAPERVGRWRPARPLSDADDRRNRRRPRDSSAAARPVCRGGRDLMAPLPSRRRGTNRAIGGELDGDLQRVPCINRGVRGRTRPCTPTGTLASRLAPCCPRPCASGCGREAVTTSSTRSRNTRQRRSLSWTSPADSQHRSAAREITSAAEYSLRGATRAAARSARSAAGVRSRRSSICAARTSSSAIKACMCAAIQSLLMIRCRSPITSASPSMSSSAAAMFQDDCIALSSQTADTGEPVGVGAQFTDHAGDLRGAPLALQEQHPVERDGSLAVQVFRALVRAQRGRGLGIGGGPPVGQRLQRSGVPLQPDRGLQRRGRVEALVLLVEPGQVQDRLQQRGRHGLVGGHHGS